jgi:Cu(I)/Ag(I) efflux system membrane protein CusA/SilA
MIDLVIDWSVRHRSIVSVMALALALWGTFSLGVAPIDAVPDLSENQVIVHAEWPDHGPEDVDRDVTARVAGALRGLRGLKALRTSSDPGSSTLWLIFEEHVGIAEARRFVGERLAETRATMGLPPGVVARIGPDGPATGQVFWYTVEWPGHDLAELRSIQDSIVKPRLEAVPGVAELASVGGMVAEVHVEADPVRMRHHKVSLPALVEAIGPSSSEEDLRRSAVTALDGRQVLVHDVATVGPGPRPRRGVLEKDGVEVVGGVALMAQGENPLEPTRRLKTAVRALASELPRGVQVIPMYDRTPLIQGAVGTVRDTILEAMLCASICVVLLLRHARAALVVAIMPPLSVLASFGVLEGLRRLGLADVPINIMSLAGLAISIGVLVDSAVVLVENSLHGLHSRYGDGPIGADAPAIVAASCRQVGRPITFALLIMLVSFLPVFALDGLEGKMFRPLALTKTLAVAASGVLAVTLVPALASWWIRGRTRGEDASPIVRGVLEVYRPVLDYVLDHPAPLLWLVAATFVLAGVAIGHQPALLAILAIGLIAVGLSARGLTGKAIGMVSLALVALIAEACTVPLGREYLAPLDEGVVMDMPISVPGMTIAQGTDDLKARDMVLCRFPEVAMVVGKLGRAETPTDPAPLDMIETMVEFHPREFWPSRALERSAIRRALEQSRRRLVDLGLIEPIDAGPSEIADAVHSLFDAQMRAYAYERNRELFGSPGFEERTWKLNGLGEGALKRWQDHTRAVDAELRERAPYLLTRISLEETLSRARVRSPELAEYVRRLHETRSAPSAPTHHAPSSGGAAMSRSATMPSGLSPQPQFDALADELAASLATSLALRPVRRAELVGASGELDRSVQMPGWTNVWTMPIQNRVDMLSTGVNTSVGVRVTGPDLDGVVAASERIAEIIKGVPGASDVVADPVRGRVVLKVRADRAKLERLDVQSDEVDLVTAAAFDGVIAGAVGTGDERRAVRVRFAPTYRTEISSMGDLPVASSSRLIPLRDVADVSWAESPATIKGENGLPRNYVRLNVRGRDASALIEEAKRVVAEQVELPEGCRVDWVGQFEHERHAARTLAWVVPVVLLLIFLLLYATFHDLADAAIMVLVVPGALAGGIVCQWVLGAKFSVTVAIGTIACFGMATATGVIMLVYLRDALARAGGLERVDEDGLRRAVLEGAVQRLRPKLLTEATTLLGLVPMLWAGGVGSEVIRPMAAPVLGGLLVADEVIDLLLPLLFFHVRRFRLRRPRRKPRQGSD